MKTIRIQIFIIAVCILSGCEKLVEIDPPQDQLISTIVFENDETASAAMSGLYGTMMKNDVPISYYISAFTALYGDELEYKQTLVSMLSLYKYALNPKDALTNTIWRNAFNYIYQANAIIEGIEQSKSVSPAIRRQLTGEALFVRSFWNYYLSLLYGKIPVILSTDYEQNSKLTKSSLEAVNAQIIQDLIAAKEFLNEKYVGANSLSESTERVRPNTFVASALLARVYLQNNDFANAEQEASRIITNSKYDLSAINLVFKRTSKEVIWQLELPTTSSQPTSNSYEARMFTLTTRPSATGVQRNSVISPMLLSLYNEKDKRRTTWIGTYTDNSINPPGKYLYPSKYKTTTTPVDEFTTPFRLAESYLIRSESRAQLGKIDDAINDIDKIRVRAGLDPLKTLTPGIQKAALLDSIAIERRRELFCEWGLRWFDIKRSITSDDLMRYIAAQKGVTWSTNWSVWPIPLNDIINGGNYLTQNDGYY